MAQQIAAVRRDLDIEDRVFWKKGRDRFADLRFRRKDQKAIAIFRESELARAAKHSLRFDPAQFAWLDFLVARQHRAGQGEGNFVANFVVLRAAHNLAFLAAPVIDLNGEHKVTAGIGKTRKDIS